MSKELIAALSEFPEKNKTFWTIYEVEGEEKKAITQILPGEKAKLTQTRIGLIGKQSLSCKIKFTGNALLHQWFKTKQTKLY